MLEDIVFDKTKVQLVLTAYYKLAHALFGYRNRQKQIKYGGKAYHNAIKFYDNAIAKGITVDEYMLACIEHYPQDWCMKVFRKKVPPFNVLTAEYTRNQVIRKIPNKITTKNTDSIADYYYYHLLKYDKDTIISLLNNGLLTDDVKDVLLKKLGADNEKKN